MQQRRKFQSDHLHSGTDVVSGQSSTMVSQLLSNLHLAFPHSQFCERFQFSNADITERVWSIIEEHLGSNPLTDHLSQWNDGSDEDEIEKDEAQAEYQEACVLYSNSDSESD